MRRTIIAILGAVAALAGGARAATYQAVHSFCTQDNCADGSDVWSVPVGDGAGNYYGNTAAGGDNGGGTIYRIAFDGTTWTYTKLYSFCSQPKCADGKSPQGALILDTAGNLYGTTEFGGDRSGGTAFELSPKGGGWVYKRLYSFCAAHKCADGLDPLDVSLSYRGAASGARYDGVSPLYGATSGNRTTVQGNVFSLTPAGKKWTEAVVHKFCTLTDCADGAEPYSGPMVDGAGNLFGVTVGGGAFQSGAIYEMIPGNKGFQETVLYSFCPNGGGCADGTGPIAMPAMDGQGNLYGTASTGGAGKGSAGQGTVYKLAPDGATWKFTKLYDFCNKPNCTDGAMPWGGLTFDTHGNLLGTTFLGGDANAGVIFTLSGKKHTTFAKVESFGTSGVPGTMPLAGLAANSATTFLGAAADGGAGNDGGVLYQLTP